MANFFQGVADRLSVDVKDVSLTAEIDLPQLGSNSVDTVKLMLKVSEIDLESVNIGGDGLDTGSSRRSVTMKNIEAVLLSESELFSQAPPSSTNSSPRLSRAQTKLSHASSKSMAVASSSPQIPQSKPEGQKYGSFMRSTLSQQSSESSSSSTPAFTSDQGLGIEGNDDAGSYDDQSMQGSSLYRPRRLITSDTSHSLPSSSHVDNRSNAETLARRGELDSSTARLGASIADSQDLAESRVFSHNEAESMYMSALSHDMEYSRPLKSYAWCMGLVWVSRSKLCHSDES